MSYCKVVGIGEVTVADVEEQLRRKGASHNVLCREIGVFTQVELDTYLAEDLQRWAVVLLLERLDESLLVLA